MGQTQALMSFPGQWDGVGRKQRDEIQVTLLFPIPPSYPRNGVNPSPALSCQQGQTTPTPFETSSRPNHGQYKLKLQCHACPGYLVAQDCSITLRLGPLQRPAPTLCCSEQCSAPGYAAKHVPGMSMNAISFQD